MRLVGILNWYDENPAWLAACIASMARAGVEHVVAVDGAYALYPGGRPSSNRSQHDAIFYTCHGAGIGCTLHVPTDVWFGNEVDKRTFAFRLAEQSTTDEDWYFVIDADWTITSALGLREKLAEEPTLAVAEIRIHDSNVEPLGGYAFRSVFRALRGLYLHGNHFTYRTEDGRRLAGQAPSLEPALDLSFVEVEHRMEGRDRARVHARDAYYERRDRLGVERAGVPA